MPPKFQKLVSRRQALLTDEIMLTAWNNEARIAARTGIETRVSDLEIVDGDYYFDVVWLEAITEQALNWPREKSVNFIEQGVSHGEHLRSFAYDLKIPDTIDESKRLFWESLELLKNLLVFLPLTHPLAKAAEKHTRSILEKKGLSQAEQDEALLQISRPRKANGPTLEEEALRKIKQQAEQDSNFDINKALEDHAKAFSYLGYREPFSQGYSLEFFRERYKDLKDIEVTPTKTFEFNSEEQKAVELLQDFVFFRNYRTEKLYESLFLLENLWKHLASHYGLGETDLGWYVEQECRDLFEREIKVDKTTIETRKAGHGLILHNNTIQLIAGTELGEKKRSITQPPEKLSHLKGVSACRGKARGPVKILRSSKDQDKVMVGDILVTAMTTPDYLPAMKRAAAFVTDEGGVTCHAAIVSRELGKPCIIGTKQATSLLEDNQLVIVDGDTGLVEIAK